MDHRAAYLHIPTAISRRSFIGAGLVIGFAASTRKKAFAAGEQPGLGKIQDITGKGDTGSSFQGFAPGGFIRIAPEGPITLIVPNVEMGQAIYTAEAMLIAEELEAGLDQVRVETAPPDEQLYRQPLLKSQTTGGSTSIRGAYGPLRQAGAAARSMLIAAAAEQWAVPVSECLAERASVRHDPSGRNLSYNQLALQAARQPVPQNVPLKDPSQWRLIGTAVHRVDSPEKVNGSAVFGIDVRVPDMRVAAVKASPVIGGKVISVDDRAARAIPGVHDVIRIANAVAVTGDHYWAARKGLDALAVVWDDGPNAKLSSEQLIRDLRDGFGKVQAVDARKEGDVNGAMARAQKRIESEYELPFLAHATMEPINTTIHVRPDGADVWVGTQVPTVARQLVAKATGLPLDKVAIHNQLLGGGFGRRLEADSIQQATELAKHVSYPIKIIWSREEDIKQDMFRPAYYDRVSAGLGADGMPLVWVDHVSGGSVTGHYSPGGLPPGQIDPDAVEGAEKPPYDFPAIHVDWTRVDPPIPFTWWRGVGPTHNVFVVESFIDELAHAAQRDPLEYRKKLLAKNPRAKAVLELVADKSNWGSPLPQRRGRGVSLHDSFGSFLAVVVEVTVDHSGEIKIDKAVAAMDCGLTINTDQVKAQIEGGLNFGFTAALYSDITLKNGKVEQGNFNDYRMLRIQQSPAFDIHVVTSTADPGGVGETGTVSAAPALGNAIFAATGVRLRRYPFDRGALAVQNVAANSSADRTTGLAGGSR